MAIVVTRPFNSHGHLVKTWWTLLEYCESVNFHGFVSWLVSIHAWVCVDNRDAPFLIPDRFLLSSVTSFHADATIMNYSKVKK